MTARKTHYELSASQVETPPDVVSLVWQLANERRPSPAHVVDFGAGDCRFARGGQYGTYKGIEIDPWRWPKRELPANATLEYGCAFRHAESEYDLCIGNPPYVRHHDIESPWKEKTVEQINNALGIALNKHSNLYLYFLCLGLMKTLPNGLVALVVPFEWVSRPSAKAIREFIESQGWEVKVYRFQETIFPDVLTTASISIIDKHSINGRWSYFDVSGALGITPREGISGSKATVLSYKNRGGIWALRGLSPGSQEVFCLTEGERRHHGLSLKDVVPCVTTLKNVPSELRVLSKTAFKKHFIDAGERCWLIKSNEKRRSKALDGYLESVPEKARDNYTCRNQTPWFNFLGHRTPEILFSSGFVKFGPKVLVNSIGAKAVGSAFGIHSEGRIPLRALQRYLLDIDFEKQVVAHAGRLKKIEVKQMNSVLHEFEGQLNRHG